MEKYSNFHKNDRVLIEEFNSIDYCRNRSPEEEAMFPFLSFPITKHCNFSCIYCGHDGEATAATVESIELSTLKEIVDIACRQNISKFRITGGEPFLHKNIEEILLFFNTLGHYTLVNTNGSLVNKNKKLIESLDHRVVKFAISLDTLNEERFKKIARPYSSQIKLQNVLEAVEFLVASGLLLRINMVVGHHNVDEIYDMITFCSKNKCNLKLLDVVSVPIPFGERQDYFIDLTPLELELKQKCDQVISHSYTKSFGVPCVQYKFGNTRVVVKNGTKGSHYDLDGACRNCSYYPCHEGLYDIFVLPDGRICSCRWTEEQIYKNSEEQLSYLIESFRKAVFVQGKNDLRVNMKVRDELKNR